MGRGHGILGAAGQARQGVAWTTAELRQELERYTAGRKTWPTRREFVASGRTDLITAVRRHGGMRFWAKELKLKLATRQQRNPLTADEAVVEARKLIRVHGYLPGPPALRELGCRRLANFVQVAGGSRAFCVEHADELFGALGH
jgi:hypothetical protein